MTTESEFQYLPTQASKVRHDLSQLATYISEPEAKARYARLKSFDDSQVFRVIITGPFSTGKTTLINALTDGAAGLATSANVNTDSNTTILWQQGIELIDTPGMQSGITSHTEKADEAILGADLVLFTVDYSFFNDEYRNHVRHVLDNLGKVRDTLFVITKSSTADISDDVIAFEIEKTTGRYALPFLRVDSLTHLRNIENKLSDADRSDEGGIQALRLRMEAIARERGRLTRFLRPFQGFYGACQIGKEECTQQTEDRKELTVLHKEVTSLTDARESLKDMTSTLLSQLASDGYLLLGETESAVTDLIAEGSSQQKLQTEVEAFAQQVQKKIEDSLTTYNDETGQIFNRLSRDIQSILDLPHLNADLFKSAGSESLPSADKAPKGLRPFLEEALKHATDGLGLTFKVGDEETKVVEIVLKKWASPENAKDLVGKAENWTKNFKRTLNFVGPFLDIIDTERAEAALTKATKAWIDAFRSEFETVITEVSDALHSSTEQLIAQHLVHDLQSSTSLLSKLEARLASESQSFASFLALQQECAETLKYFGQKLSSELQ